MSIPYESVGRTAQKARTREALVAAARDLLAGGRTPTVEEAAASAGVSRTTAYRYFPSRRALVAAAYPEVEAASLLGDAAPDDPAERFALAVRAMTDLVVAWEPGLRATLRVALEPAGEGDALPLRGGRAIGWLADAVAPLRGRLPEERLRLLVLATRAACGIEALVWLTDVAGLSRDEAVEVMRWSARALWREATGEEPPPP